MMLSKAIAELQKIHNKHGDMKIVMDEGGKGDISDSVGFSQKGTPHNCTFQVIGIGEGEESDEHWKERLDEAGVSGKLPMLLINIDF